MKRFLLHYVPSTGGWWASSSDSSSGFGKSPANKDKQFHARQRTRHILSDLCHSNIWNSFFFYLPFLLFILRETFPPFYQQILFSAKRFSVKPSNLLTMHRQRLLCLVDRFMFQIILVIIPFFLTPFHAARHQCARSAHARSFHRDTASCVTFLKSIIVESKWKKWKIKSPFHWTLIFEPLNIIAQSDFGLWCSRNY